jgi:hypothetical protein
VQSAERRKTRKFALKVQSAERRKTAEVLAQSAIRGGESVRNFVCGAIT